MEKGRGNEYPIIHFAPKFGWLNDPNGLVYHDGIYELYYQSNPDGIEWDNMTWGHARSRDLMHWDELEPVLFPDENGMMFSGCGLRNDRGELGLSKEALLFPYTAAKFDKEKNTPHFTIRLAYSEDGGDTLIKKDGTIMTEVGPDNRDPKVFWHEESGAYVLVIWLEGNDFGIYRSSDMEFFELSERYTMPDGFECPDLFELPVYDEKNEVTEKKWVFWSADGSYVVGDFDGFHFSEVTEKQRAYWDTRMPYAAQTWSGDPKGRVIQAAWLRTKCINKQTTSSVSLPRELSLVKDNKGYVLKQSLPKEITDKIEDEKVIVSGSSYKCSCDAAISIKIENPCGDIIKLYGENPEDALVELEHSKNSNALLVTYNGATEFINLGRNEIKDIHIIYDRGIIEISAHGDTLIQMTDIPYIRTEVINCAKHTAGEGKITIGIIK